MRITAVLILFLVATSAYADYDGFRYPGLPNCPNNSPQQNWRDYMARQYPGRGEAVVTLIMEKDVGPLHPHQCSSVLWNNGVWFTQIGGGVTSLPGPNPLSFKMNVAGVILTYDEYALAYYKGERVGRLVCYLTDRC